MDALRGQTFDMVHIMRRKNTGYSVFPAKARKLMMNMGQPASRKEIMESGVRVKPRLEIMVCEE